MWFPSTCHNFCLVRVDLMIHLKIFGLCGDKSKQTIPNCRQLCCAVVTENTVPILLYDSSHLTPSSLWDCGGTCDCGSSACVTGGVTHMAHCAAHAVFAPGLWPHHPCHPGRLPFPSVQLP